MFNTAKVAHFYGFPSPQGQKSATSLPVFIVYSGFSRAIRGGSWWVDDVDACRISCKRCIWPSNNEDNIGFRLAL